MTREPTRIIWTADRSGTAHARLGRVPRTLCGIPATELRLSWPERSRCALCLRLAPR